ncbi:efflux RND transporter periplasmic adaptor subunit [Limnohabitans sp.]|uniref:efflux RND transporter periplasmic adaptor subunit n=1 Tax=Limnohabitans sp. TaxID=1907725 RepID=UPI00286F4420|nr:efflux RND transporter periplasmic adaptor subunit [Limnohabitans sp.]
MKPKLSRSLRLAAAVFCCVFTLSACQKATTPEAEKKVNDAMRVSVPESLKAQIQTAEVTSQDMSDTLRVAGQIDFDEQALTRIGASVTGRVTQINAQLGQVVNKGGTLALINSSELSGSQLAYLRARSEKELHRRNVERAKTLFSADVISAAELQRRENEFEIASAETRAAQDQLRVLGVSAAAIERLAATGKIDSVASVVATIKGVVVERKIAAGQVVQPSDVLFAVADLSRVWAVAQVPEQQISQVKVGQSVSIEVPALADEKLVGKLIYVGQTVNPDTRTVLVRTELDNTSGRLKPSMLASMLIESAPVPRVVVPITAVVRQDEVDHVFVEESNNYFRLIPVKLAAEQNGQRVVLEGLKPGMRIVSEGAFHLNNHRNLSEMENGG